jgi:hypothetical protein
VRFLRLWLPDNLKSRDRHPDGGLGLVDFRIFENAIESTLRRKPGASAETQRLLPFLSDGRKVSAMRANIEFTIPSDVVSRPARDFLQGVCRDHQKLLLGGSPTRVFPIKARHLVPLFVRVCATLLSSHPALAQFSQQEPKLVGNAFQGGF